MPTLNPTSPTTPFDVDAIRADFPILHTTVYDKPLVYLDNAATSQKPAAVIDALDRYYKTSNANIHRGIHALSERATAEYEAARLKAQRWIGAGEGREIVLTRGTTESINLVASSWGRANLQPGDEVLITWMEHHSNIVPWQMICEQTGATLRVAPIIETGELDLDAYTNLLNPDTKMVAAAHVSNALGTINPVKQMIQLAHNVGAVVLLDGAQAAPHARVDVTDLGCDFYAFSAHKMCGPTGVGVLYGRADLLDAMPPYQGGGDMIKSVTFERTEYNDIPYRFEAGTPHIAGGIALGAAIDYLASIDFDGAIAHEHALTEYATEKLTGVEGLRLIGTAAQKTSVLSFVIDGLHPYDMAPVLDRTGVAVRTGHHCAQPIMDYFGVEATVRASLAFYNTFDEIDTLIAAIEKARDMLG
ncbi:MAG: SufS family cysteine desulfurase [Planctomycetota bacterium]|jgi:cysteine desulfurase/selenocysteine lyase